MSAIFSALRSADALIKFVVSFKIRVKIHSVKNAYNVSYIGYFSALFTPDTNFRMRTIICLMAILFLCIESYAQREVVITQVIQFDQSLVDNNPINISLVIPDSLGTNQNVIDRNFSIKPTELRRDDEKKALTVYWKNLNLKELAVNHITAMSVLSININDFQTISRKSYNDIETENRDEYLESSTKGDKIYKEYKNVAKKIDGDGKIENLEMIFSATNQIYSPAAPQYNNYGGRKYVSSTGGKGAQEYSELMSEVCRLKGIPTKSHLGYYLWPDGNLTEAFWPEVFISDYGWISYDPFANDQNVNAVRKDSLENRYVSLTHNPETELITISPLNEKTMKAINYQVTYSGYEVDQFKKAKNYLAQGEIEKSTKIIDFLIEKNTGYSQYIDLKSKIAIAEGDMEAGLSYLQDAYLKAITPYEKGQIFYSYATYFAMNGQKENALSALHDALGQGFNDIESIKTNEHFELLKGSPRFIKILVSLE